MSLSNYLEGAVLDHVFNLSPLTAPSLYVALSTADPGEDASGLAEPAGNGYARVAAASWSRTDNRVSNSAAVQFPEATGAWGTITHFAVMDAADAGNLLFKGALSPNRDVNSGDTLFFAADGPGLTLD